MYGGTFRLGAPEEELLEGVVCCDYSTLFSRDSKSSSLLLVRWTSDNIAIKCCCMDWLGVPSVLVDGDSSDIADLGMEGVDLTLLVWPLSVDTLLHCWAVLWIPEGVDLALPVQSLPVDKPLDRWATFWIPERVDLALPVRSLPVDTSLHHWAILYRSSQVDVDLV